MTRNITLSADETLIEKARKQAKNECKSLNVVFREWLFRYANRGKNGKKYESIMNGLKHVNPGRRFTREEMNER